MRCISFALIAALLVGCGNNQTSDFKPPAAAAREALTQGLTAWQAGAAAGAIPAPASGQPMVQFVDFQWTAGKRLKNFTIVDEPPTLQDSTHKFLARLEVEGEPPADTEYYINGIDPVWVLRDKDYQQSSMQ